MSTDFFFMPCRDKKRTYRHGGTVSYPRVQFYPSLFFPLPALLSPLQKQSQVAEFASSSRTHRKDLSYISMDDIAFRRLSELFCI